MQEIEIKFKVDNLEKVKEFLKKEGCLFSPLLNQKDTIFVSDLDDVVVGEGKVFTRVRSVNGKYELNLKKQSKKLMQSEEVEFEVSNYDEALSFLELLDLKKWVVVEKKRITTKYKDYNICIDEVKRLGSFVEIEIVTSRKNNTDFYEKEILGVAGELGIDINNRINSFYDVMISELDK